MTALRNGPTHGYAGTRSQPRIAAVAREPTTREVRGTQRALCQRLETATSAAPPPADDDGLRYDTDLLTLASAGDLTGSAPEPAPDPELEAEPDSFAALLAHDRTDSSTAAPTDLEETP